MHLPTLLWALIVAIGLLLPGPDLPQLDADLDWLAVAAHFVLCSVLAFLLYRSWSGAAGAPAPWPAVFAVCFLYSGLLEVAQIWIPGRSWQVGDLVVNAIGISVGLLAARGLAQE